MARSKSYQLEGEVDGKPYVCPLTEGEQVVGSAETCGLHLSARGVSRRHAALTVEPEGVRLHDLDSKNGTSVNGQPVDCGALAAGDVIGLGPVRLRLVEIDSDDAVMGMAVEMAPAPAPLAPGGETSLLPPEREMPLGAHLRLIEACLERFSVRPESDLAGVLELLVRGLEAVAACLVEWPSGGRPVVVAAAGEVGEIPPAERLAEARPDRHRGGLAYLYEEGPPALVCAVESVPGDISRGLALWSRDGAAGQEPILALLLRLGEHFRPREVRSLAAVAVEKRHDVLDFPAGIVPGESPAMRSLYQQMVLLGKGDVPMLIVGETGVGKEHLAATLHRSSSRKGPFVAINCAAIPAELLEAEMFGIGKGVATGVLPRAGKFLEARDGTLFLDEIGDMSAELQAKLLRALQDKVIHPLGGAATAVDVRVVAATNTDLKERIREGRFRRDLYYRLAGYVLEVPPLRRRREDLHRLISHFIRRFCGETSKTVRGVSVKALRALAEHSWPGNVRELEHEVRRLIYLCPNGQAIVSGMLSGEIATPESSGGSGGSDETADLDETGALDLESRLTALESRLIRQALDRTGGNQSRAARLLGVSRNGLANRLKRLEIDPEEWRD